MNYVGTEKLYAWYAEKAKEPRMSNAQLLEEVHQHFVDTRVPEYILPAGKTLSGQTETYPFRAENIGACGANTGFMYF